MHGQVSANTVRMLACPVAVHGQFGSRPNHVADPFAQCGCMHGQAGCCWVVKYSAGVPAQCVSGKEGEVPTGGVAVSINTVCY